MFLTSAAPFSLWVSGEEPHESAWHSIRKDFFLPKGICHPADFLDNFFCDYGIGPGQSYHIMDRMRYDRRRGRRDPFKAVTPTQSLDLKMWDKWPDLWDRARSRS